MRKRMILTGLLASGFFATGMGADPGTHEPVGTELHAEEYVVGAMNAKPEKVLEAEASERAIKIERTSEATPVEEEEEVVVEEEEAKVVVEPVATPTPTPTPAITEEPEPEPVVTVEPEPVIEYSEEPEPVMEEEVVEEPVVEYSEEPVAVAVAVEEEPVVEVEEEVEEEPVPTPTVSATETPAATVEESVSVWDELAECESGGDWTINTGNGFFGGTQFSKTSWDAMGGTEFAPYPHQATREEQIAVAERLQAVQGWGAWPLCSQKIGLR